MDELARASIRSVIAHRRAQRSALLDEARRFADALDVGLGVRSVVVFGSVARGDFNLWSDIDVLVVADDLPPSPLQRAQVLGSASRVSVLAWTPDELRASLARRNPIALEAHERGVLLRGSAVSELVA